MTCTEEYKEHIEYTFQAFCKVVIRNVAITAARTRSRKYKREISLEYLTDEKHYPLGTAGKDFRVPEPDEEYIIQICGDTGEAAAQRATISARLSGSFTKKWRE